MVLLDQPVLADLILQFVPPCNEWLSLREICRICKRSTENMIGCLGGLRLIMRSLESGPDLTAIAHDGEVYKIRVTYSPFFFDLDKGFPIDSFCLGDQLELDIAALEMARRLFGYRDGDGCVVPLAPLSIEFLCPLVLHDPDGKVRYPTNDQTREWLKIGSVADVDTVLARSLELMKAEWAAIACAKRLFFRQSLSPDWPGMPHNICILRHLLSSCLKMLLSKCRFATCVYEWEFASRGVEREATELRVLVYEARDSAPDARRHAACVLV